jgi:mxaJ protein
VRNTLKAPAVRPRPGVPADFERVRTTRPYYRSSYVFVTRKDAARHRLLRRSAPRARRIGVQLIGDDMAATPPVHALGARRGIVGQRDRLSRLWRRCGRRRAWSTRSRAASIDAALSSGARRPAISPPAQAVPLKLTPVAAHRRPALPMIFEFSIAMGVKRGNDALRGELDAALPSTAAEIDAILARYHVPRTDASGSQVR